jgi:hypothetical protein
VYAARHTCLQHWAGLGLVECVLVSTERDLWKFTAPGLAALRVSHKYRELGKALAPRPDVLSGDMTTWELYRSLVGSGWRHEVQQKGKAHPLTEPRAPF